MDEKNFDELLKSVGHMGRHMRGENKKDTHVSKVSVTISTMTRRRSALISLADTP